MAPAQGAGGRVPHTAWLKLLCLIRAMFCCQKIAVFVAELLRGTCWIPSAGDNQLCAAQDPTLCRCQLLAGGQVGALGSSASGHPGLNPKTMFADLNMGCDEEGAVV